MTEITEAAKAKACELANSEGGGELYPAADLAYTFGHYPDGDVRNQALTALAKLVQQFSDAAKAAHEALDPKAFSPTLAAAAVQPFILADPVDPLAEAFVEWAERSGSGPACPPSERARLLRKVLTERGLEIREISK